MKQVEVAEVAPSYEALERAIACVPGVVSATVTRSDTTGRSSLRIRLAPGEHAETVSWSVAATLRERFGIALDPAEIRPRPADAVTSNPPAGRQLPHDPDDDPVRLVDAQGDHALSETRDRLTSAARAALDGLRGGHAGGADPVEPAAPRHDGSGLSQAADAATTTGPASDQAATVEPSPAADRSAAERDRVEIRNLDTQCDPHGVRATATLTHRGRIVHGEGDSVPTTHGILRAVAEATVDALRALTGPVLLAGVDGITLQPATDPGIVTVVVTLLTERGEETLLGSSVVRRDTEHAVMRATLDALNRRVAPMLDAKDTAVSDQPA